MTNYVQKELDRIGEALHTTPMPDDYAELYAAQQALAWVLEPGGFASPFNMIRKISVPTNFVAPDPDDHLYFVAPYDDNLYMAGVKDGINKGVI